MASSAMWWWHCQYVVVSQWLCTHALLVIWLGEGGKPICEKNNKLVWMLCLTYFMWLLKYWVADPFSSRFGGANYQFQSDNGECLRFHPSPPPSHHHNNLLAFLSPSSYHYHYSHFSFFLKQFWLTYRHFNPLNPFPIKMAYVHLCIKLSFNQMYVDNYIKHP